jgi:hypothetical protein
VLCLFWCFGVLRGVCVRVLVFEGCMCVLWCFDVCVCVCVCVCGMVAR